MLSYKQVPSPNFGYPRGAHGQNQIEAVVWHITASRPTNPPLIGLDSWFTNPAAGASHLGIQDGEVHQYVAFADAPWHAGLLQNPDLSNANVARWWNGNINPNVRTIGIEVVSLPGVGNVRHGQHRLSEATWETMVKVGADLVERFPGIKLQAVDWIGHGQIDGISRTRDPFTVYWPVDIMKAILAEEDDDDMAVVDDLRAAIREVERQLGKLTKAVEKQTAKGDAIDRFQTELMAYNHRVNTLQQAWMNAQAAQLALDDGASPADREAALSAVVEALKEIAAAIENKPEPADA